MPNRKKKFMEWEDADISYTALKTKEIMKLHRKDTAQTSRFP